MKKAISTKSTVSTSTKLAVKPVTGGWDGTSAALTTPEAVAAAYAPVKARALRAGHKIVAKVQRLAVKKAAPKAAAPKAKPAAPKAVEPTESEEKVNKAVALAAKVAAKKPEPPTKSELHKAVKKAGFKFVQAQKVEDTVAYGYVHKDQRAVLITVQANGDEAWQLCYPDGAVSGGAPTGKLATFVALLGVSTARHNASKERAAKKMAKAVAASPVDTSMLGSGAEDDYVAPIKPTAVAGVPANLARAVEMLGAATRQYYNVADLTGDKNYGVRLGLLKKLFDRERVLVAETGVNKLTQAFYSAVGVGEGTLAAKAEEFTRRCKEIAKRVRAAKTEARKVEEARKKIVLRRTAAERALPGVILPSSTRLTRAQQAAKDAEDRAYVKSMATLAVSAEQPAVPHPDAELSLVAEDLRLLEDPENGIVMLQMEKSNSQGAICVYNNGSRVAAGVVAPETLKRLRPVPPDTAHGVGSNEMLLQAAHQLLNPVVPSVPVTHVAARHLTAVTHCKELIPMATVNASLSTGRKFAAPASTKTTKTAEKAPKAEKTGKATKAAKPSAAESESPRGRKAAVPDNAKITILTEKKANPYREGSKAHVTFDLLKQSKTAGAFREAAKADPDTYDITYLTWATVEHGKQPAYVSLAY